LLRFRVYRQGKATERFAGEPFGPLRESKGVTLGLVQAQPAGPTDAEAIAASLDSPSLFAGVFERHYPTLHRYLARRLGTDLADELAAEAFAVAFAKRGRYDGAFEDARPWLFGIATRLVHRHWRREERELRAYARTGVDPASPPHDERVAARADSAVAGPALAAALASLSRDERDVLLLHAWEELGYPEVAAALSISLGTVKSRLHRARQRVRQSLAAAGELDPLRSE
jgi:RNA polymerase sigma factor (sigma-70 family)